VKASGLSFAGRRFWQIFTAHAARIDREPAPSDFDALLARTRTGRNHRHGSVTLSAPAQAIRNSSRCAPCASCRRPT
jgi:hypothetical protein